MLMKRVPFDGALDNEVIEKIVKTNINFHHKEFTVKSIESVDLLKKMLFKDYNARISALEAVKLWRDEVLPTLPAGTVVVANPTETEKDRKSKQIRGQRERIYQMAGMGSTDPRGVMAGLVTDEGTIVPIKPTAEQKKQMQIESKYINLIGQNLNNEEIKLVYEMLFT